MTAAGWVISRNRRPLSRGTRFVLLDVETGAMFVAYSHAEASAIIAGGEARRAPMPGARAALVRPARRYL